LRSVQALRAAKSEQKAHQRKLADFGGLVMTLAHCCYD
jgi:hypothetical protein